MGNPRHSKGRRARHEIENINSAPIPKRSGQKRHGSPEIENVNSAQLPRHSGPVRKKAPRHAMKLEPTPTPSSMESDANYERRIKHGSYAEEGIRKRRKRGIVIAVVIALIAIALAVSAGVYSYLKNTDERLQLSGPEIEGMLQEPQANSAYYVLCTADLSDKQYAYSRTTNKAFMLVRIDEQARTVTFITVPSEITIEFPNEEFYSLADYPASLGEEAVVYAVSKLAGVPISHYVRTDAAHIADMVDLVGGVTMNVEYEIDDPEAGTKVIKPGEHDFTGSQALVVLRATNIPGGFAATADYRMAFTIDLVTKALDNKGIGLASIVSDASNYIETDWTASELLGLGDAFGSSEPITFYQCMVPYTKAASAKDGSTVYHYVESEWQELMGAVSQGLDPASIEHVIGEVNEKEVTVEVRNGAQINGAATKLGGMLSDLGFNVLSVGNVEDGTMYPETLVVYTKEEYEDAALSIVRDIGAGRVVNGGDFYTSKADVIVIIGIDWST